MLPDVIKALFILIILGVLVWMLIDVLNRHFPAPWMRVLWFVVLTFIPVLGLIAYYFLVMKKGEGKS